MENKYYKKDNTWYYKDKNGMEKKVGNTKTLELLKQSEKENKTPMQGIGDFIEKITTALNIKKCDACEKRRKKLNEMLPFINNKKIEPLTIEEELLIEEIQNLSTLSSEQVIKIFNFYNKRFTKIEICNCPGTIKRMIEILSNLERESDLNQSDY
jgi:hypothetical protein